MLRSVRLGACALVLVNAPLSIANAAEPAPPTAPTARAKACSERYMTTLEMDKMMKAMNDSMATSLKGVFAKNEGQTQEAARVEKAVIKVLTEVMDDITPKIIGDVSATMTTVFDEAELCAMADFYDSPVGRSIVAKMPAVMEASMSASRKYMPEMQERVVVALCRELDCTGTPLEKPKAS